MEYEVVFPEGRDGSFIPTPISIFGGIQSNFTEKEQKLELELN
jgi:hypothetical protein